MMNEDAEYERMKAGYDLLLDWVEASKLDDNDVLGLLLKAAMSLAVFHEIPKREILEAVSFLYHVERSSNPTPAELH